MARDELAFGGQLIEQLSSVLGVDGRKVRRIVLDVTFDNFTMAYIEMFGSDKLLKVDWAAALQDTKVKVIGKDNNDG